MKNARSDRQFLDGPDKHLSDSGSTNRGLNLETSMAVDLIAKIDMKRPSITGRGHVDQSSIPKYQIKRTLYHN